MKKRYPGMGKQIAILGLCLQFTQLSCVSNAVAAPQLRGYYGKLTDLAPPLPNALPTGENIRHGIGSVDRNFHKDGSSDMTVHQNKPQAVIHWGDFNIGSKASVFFDQQDQSWKVLNRVVGDGYSQIYGSLSAKGQVYLLNQNGILFGPGAQVNVHTLVASSLNMREEDYLHTDPGTGQEYVEFPKFSAAGREAYYHDPSRPKATVANHGTITSNGAFGGLFLIGSEVENHGSMEAPAGQVALAAGDTVELRQHELVGDATSTIKTPWGSLRVTASGGAASGTATNFGVEYNNDGTVKYQAARITADNGLAGMYGRIVNQDGLIRSVTANTSGAGHIELKGSHQVTTGVNSETSTPIYVPTTEEEQKQDRIIAGGADLIGKITIEAAEGSIEHYGKISAPGGDVTLTARDRVLLENNSSIDVSGSWVGLSGSDRMVEVQLNSKELRDAFVLKDGPLVGETVQVDTLTGLAIADISEYLSSRAQSSLERTVNGGTITIEATGDNGEVVVKEKALLDFGGGVRVYGEGLIEDTPVRVGNRMYSLSQLPEGMRVDEVLGRTVKEHERWGVEQEWLGLYYGGSTALKRYLPSFEQGGDAGRLTIKARKVVLDGTLNGSVVRGIYQDLLEDPRDENGYLMAAGRRIPVAGSLILGEPASQKTSIVEDIVIAKDVAATEVRAGELLADHDAVIRTSFLDADKLNAAQLGNLTLHSNSRVVVEEGAELRMENPAPKADVLGNAITAAVGGKFSATAKAIEHYGSIVAPGGTISLTTQNPFPTEVTDPLLMNPLQRQVEWQNINSQIFIGEKSLLSAAGARIDNSIATGDKARPDFGLTAGGTINLNSESSKLGMFMVQGAAIDVGGGYEITLDGTARGGDAGIFEATSGHVNMALDGDIRGHALPGRKGGTIRLHAETVNVAKTAPVLPAGFSADDPLPAGMQTGLVLAENRLDGTGFSNIELKAARDLTVEQGVNLAPSYSRSTRFVPALLRGRQPSAGIVEVEPEYAGDTSITLKAGEDFVFGGVSTDGRLLLAQGSTLIVAPGGAIALKADNGNLTVQGQVSAPAGAISLKGTNIILAEGGRLDASGVAVADLETTVKGFPVNRKVLNGGSVVLDAGQTVTMGRNAVIDVSGSQVVTNTLSSPAGPVVQTLASAPGSIEVNYTADFDRQGDLLGRAHLAGLPGGSLTIDKADETTGQRVRQGDIDHYLANGFDDITLASLKALVFNDSVTIHAGRRLTLNSPELAGTGEHTVSLAAPWLRLWNITPGQQYGDNIISNDNTTPAGGKGVLKADADFIDVQGDVALAGLGETTLQAARDIRLYDYFYNKLAAGNQWSGGLRTGGNLTMQAAAIYPATHQELGGTAKDTHKVFPTDFTIMAAGKVTTLPGQAGNRQPIASAGGRLRIEAQDIEHRGEIAAPLGTVELEARGRVLLAEGSTISTKGETRALYGTLQNEKWEVRDGESDNADAKLLVAAAPGKKVMVSGQEVIQAPGAQIDVSGGGSILAYEFLPGYDGTVNPLAKEGRFVVMADNSVSVPGAAVYLEGIPGLAAGTYAKLSAEYAFQPGAMVIEKTGSAMAPGQVTATTEGYAVVAGYDTEAGTGLVSPVREGYIVRSAADILRLEGTFDLKEMMAGDAGQVEIRGETTILAGSINAKALAGYKGGALDLSAANIEVANGMGDLLAGVDLNDFNAPLDAKLSGKMFLDTALFTGKGLRELAVGSAGTTGVITVKAGTKIETVPTVRLTAKADSGEIVLEDGVRIEAMGAAGESEGSITISAQTVTAGENTSLHASDLLQINTDNLRADTFKADLTVDHGTLGFAGRKIFLEPEEYTGSRAEGGIYLNDDMLKKFASTDTVELTSKSDLVFLGSVGLAAGNDLTLDAARITVANNGAANTVTVDAGKGLTMANSGATSTGNDAQNTSSIGFTAETITFGPGATTLDNFNSVGFASSGETVFNGEGALTADLAAGGKLTMDASRFIATMTPEVTADDTLVFKRTDYTVDSKAGALAFTRNGAKQDSGIVAMPGALTLKGNTIDLNQARFDLPSGKLVFEATSNITMNGASILARGGAFNFPIQIGTERYDNSIPLSGGQVALKSATGTLSIDAESEIDTSATDGQKGGEIVLEAAVGGVGLDGTVKGGSFAMDTDTIGDFGKLARTLAAGGFDRRISLRARTGNVAIGKENSNADEYITVTTENFKLVADGADSTADNVTGKIDIYGKVDASAEGEGGTIEMYAKNDLTLRKGGLLQANGTGEDADGGEVFLSSAEGAVKTERTVLGPDPDNGITEEIIVPSIYVSGSGSGQGGMVTFRAGRDKVESGAVALDGAIAGARSVRMQAVKKYNDSAVTSTDIVGSKIWDKVAKKWVITPGWIVDANTFMDTMASRWSYGDIDLIPEIEVWNAGNITVSNGLNALQNYRFGGNPAVLTVRAGENLAVNTDIIDSPGAVEPLMDVKMPVADGKIDTWGFNLMGGADLGSADFMAVKKSETTGDITFGAGKQIFSESGSIQFASGRDTVIGVASTADGFMPGTNYYTLATFDGSVTGSVGRDLKMDTGGVIETGLGDIRLVVGRDILLGDAFSNDKRGAIRTVGRAQNLDELPAWMQSLLAEGGVGADFVQSIRAKRYWDFFEGGNIDIIAGRDISGYVNTASAVLKEEELVVGASFGWDRKYTKMKDNNLGTITEVLGYDDDGNPIVTLNDRWGADYAGGAGATQGIATMANGDIAIQAGGAFYGQAATFGQGDLSVEANGSVNGRFMAMDGTATLTAKENFGANYAGYTGTQYASAIEIGDTQLTVAALGNIDLGTVSNPEFTAGVMSTVWSYEEKSEVHSTLSYTEKTSLTAQSALGDIFLSGENYFLKNDASTSLLPASLAMAAGRDINFSSMNSTMAPAAQGNLTVFAGRDIQGGYEGSAGTWMNSSLKMYDMDPAGVYGTHPSIVLAADSHDPEVLHRDDARPVEVKAGRDIAHLGLKLAKRAEVLAGRDIREINYQGQNINLADVSMVRAGHDIDLQTSAGYATNSDLGIEQAGPGFLLVQAGNSLNLGSSDGITTVGDTDNKSLNPLVDPFSRVKGSDLAVIVGYNLESEKEELSVFFEKLAVKGDMYNFLSNTGKSNAVDIKDDKLSEIKKYITFAIDDPFLDEETLSATMDQFVLKNLNGAGDIRKALSAIAATAEKDELVNLAAGFANCYKERMLATLIDPMLAGKKTGSGNIRMVNSRIKTVTGQDEIHILAAGQIDVGTSVLNTSGVMSANGIMTEGGGNINVLSEGDINVNESRVVTYFGGRVFLLSNHGDINAGIGSKTAVSLPATDKMIQNGKLVPKYSAPGVGSGIRALTYDSDGPGRLAAPRQGDVIAIPWEGILDAGEAGIFGAKVSIGAREVLNGDNISFSGSGVGVPVSGAAGPSLGALAGAGTISDAAKAGDSVGRMNSGNDLASAMAKVAESLNIKMVVVKFIDFEDGSNTTNMGGSNGI